MTLQQAPGQRRRRGGKFVAWIAALAITATAAPCGAVAAAPEAFVFDLFEPGDFVGQVNEYYCIPASIQTMVNLVEDGALESAPEQRRLYGLARRLSTPKLVGTGAEAEGWAGALNELGYGPYVVHVADTRSDAIRDAARALRLTGRPAGLMVWRGAHSWVMSGFRASVDPALSPHFTVTHIRVQDPWYPRRSSIWGSSTPPDTLVAVDALGEDFLPFRRPTVRYPDKDGRFVVVLPLYVPRGSAGMPGPPWPA